MKRILFVDDDPNILQGLKRMLRSMRHEWDMTFAMSGQEALNILAESPFDVVVSDMRMPEMDGGKLLSIVMKQYPETVRIILSGHSDRDMILRSVMSTHQFLVKPCDAETIKFTIERACKLRDLLRNEELRKIVVGIDDLPSLPTLYGLIIKEMQSPKASLKKVGYIISQDVSMSAKILQLVNSAFFGLPRRILDPQQAVIYLGIETLKALVLSIHVFSSFTEDSELSGFSLSDMWRHSLMVGSLAREIAHGELVGEKLKEEALIAGILHDIGKLILLKISDQYKQIQDFNKKNGCSDLDAEYKIMKTSHAELGAYLLGLWGIPDCIVETVAFHHNPSGLLDKTFVGLNKGPNKDRSRTRTIGNSDLMMPLAKMSSTEFTTLMAVHVANALINQENCTSDSTDFPHIDMRFISALNLTDKLPGWAECCDRIRQKEV